MICESGLCSDGAPCGNRERVIYPLSKFSTANPVLGPDIHFNAVHDSGPFCTSSEYALLAWNQVKELCSDDVYKGTKKG